MYLLQITFVYIFSCFIGSTFYTDPNHSLHSRHAPPKPIDNIRCTAGNILLTWSSISISHWGSMSEPIRVLLEASEHRGGYLVSGVKPVNSNQAPSKSASHFNTCRQLELCTCKSMEHGKVNAASHFPLQTRRKRFRCSGGRGGWY